LTFRIPLSAQTPQANLSAHRKPSYVGATTQGVTIAIAYPGATYPAIAATKQCDASGQNCAFVANVSLPVEPQAYSFSIVDYGKNGAQDVLSEGTLSQVLVPGPNVVSVTLSPVVAQMSFSIPGTPVPGGAANQVFPVSFVAYDADGSTISGTAPYTKPFPVGYVEIDSLGAFSLKPGATGSATCVSAQSICDVTSNADTLDVAFNPGANGFPSDPAYYPSEFILFDAANGFPSSYTAMNSGEIATAPCTNPQPICVYSPAYYSGLVASGLPGSGAGSYVPFSPTIATANQSTIWTDVGIVTNTSGPQPAYASYPASLQAPTFDIASIDYIPATGTAFAPDYSGSGAATQAIASIPATGAVSVSQYPSDTQDSLYGASSGAAVVQGPDGNIWWIDPITGVLRYAAPSNPAAASICVLQPGTQIFLTAAGIAATPPGVTPSRIWFTAVDTINSNNYIGYVNVSAGSNSCGSGQAGHYAQLDTFDPGDVGPPNGLAVDGSGNAWYDEGDTSDSNNDNIGEATVNASTGAVVAPNSRPLPAAFQNAEQVWGIVYDQSDKNMYFAADDGVVGRFDPAAGLSSAKGYALPLPLADALFDYVEGPQGEDEECSDVPGPCAAQFSWDAGTSAGGRLTFVAESINFAIGTLTPAYNAPVQLDLSGPGVTFSASVRGRRTVRHAHHRRAGRFRRPGIAFSAAGLL
jgi:hypothetical protein